MSDKASESAKAYAEGTFTSFLDGDEPQEYSADVYNMRFMAFLAGYEKGREVAKSELRDELKAAFEAGESISEITCGDRFDEWYEQQFKTDTE
jgi:hypothetical protein